MCEPDAHVCVEARHWCHVSFSVALGLSFFETVSHWTSLIQLACLASELQKSVHPVLHAFWRSRLRSSCLHSRQLTG